MVVGELATPTDVLVIGGGPGGYAAAIRLGQAGRQVTLIEANRVGGTCLNVGCIPSKALIEVANTFALPDKVAQWGLDMVVDIDMLQVQHHLTSVVDSLSGGVDTLLAAAGVDVVPGVAYFSRPDRVAVELGAIVEHFSFDHAIVAVGSRPIELDTIPVDGERVLNSTDALRLTYLPSTITIVGGGYIGIELGTAFAKLGSQVTIVEMADRILPAMPESLVRIVSRRLKQLGVEVLTGGAASGLNDQGLVVDADGASTTIESEVVVVAVGRRPNTDRVGLEQAGVRLDERGLVVVDGARRASSTVHAIGDITPGPALAHKATAEAEVAVQSILGNVAEFNPACIPEVVFSDPELVSVGATSDDVPDPQVFRFPFGASARARTLGHTDGAVEIVADGAGTVMGVHMAGPHVSELAGEASLAIEMAATLDDLALTIHPHPTLGEAFAEAAHGALGHPLHVARKAKRQAT